MHLIWADQNVSWSQMYTETCNDCTSLWESTMKYSKDKPKTFINQIDNFFTKYLSFQTIPPFSSLTLHYEAEEKSIYRLLYLHAQMLRLINALALLGLFYLFMAHLKTFHYLIMHNMKNQIIIYLAQRDTLWSTQDLCF